MPDLAALKQKIETREAVVAIVGVGYVGLPLADAMHTAGHRVLAIDTDPKKVEMLNKGKPYLKHLGIELSERLTRSNRFEASSNLARLSQADAILICVPTPLDDKNQPDLQFVLATARAVGRSLRAGQLIVLESTTYPGTTRDEFLPAMLSGAQGIDLPPDDAIFVAYSPERENPGDTDFTTTNTPKIISGLGSNSLEAVRTLYDTAFEMLVPVPSLEIAEAAKLYENVFRAVNIALVNELKLVFDKMDIDIWDVVRAASTKPFGFMPFYPGPGLGGHCIPIDPFYLAHKARECGRPSRFIELAGQINTRMPEHVIDALARALTKPIDQARVLVVGLAYKPDVDDIRESPSFELLRILQESGADAQYHDPHVPRTKIMRRYSFNLESVELTPDTIRTFDALIISTNHASIDYDLLASHAALIVDTRDAMRPFEHILGDRLVRA